MFEVVRSKIASHNQTISKFFTDNSKFEEALPYVYTFFNIKSLNPDKASALKAVFNGNDLYFSRPTGYGKSLIFQCLPMIHNVLKDDLIGTCKAFAWQHPRIGTGMIKGDT